ncbi:Hypothetical protein J6889_03915 [Nakaseomyces glabratus]
MTNNDKTDNVVHKRDCQSFDAVSITSDYSSTRSSTPDYKHIDYDSWLYNLFKPLGRLYDPGKKRLIAIAIAILMLVTLGEISIQTEGQKEIVIKENENNLYQELYSPTEDTEGTVEGDEIESMLDSELDEDDRKYRDVVGTKAMMRGVNVKHRIDNQEFFRLAIPNDIKQNRTIFYDKTLSSYYGNIDTDKFVDTNDEKNCDLYKFEEKISYMNRRRNISPNLKKVRQLLLDENTPRSKFIKQIAQKKGYNDTMAVERQFFTTTTSILWLEQHVCYISFTGVVISEAEDVNKPSLTVISSQAFDDQWKEIEKDIGFIDEKIPDSLSEAFKRIESEYDANKNCDDEANNVEKDCLNNMKCDIKDKEKKKECENNHKKACDKKKEDKKSACKLLVSKNKKLADEEKKAIKTNFYALYPMILDVPTETNTAPTGFKRLSATLRETDDGVIEPLLTYQFEETLTSNIYYALPHRKYTSSGTLKVEMPSLRSRNGYWIPFTKAIDMGTKQTVGHVHLISNTLPLVTAKCSFDKGECFVLYNSRDTDKNDDNSEINPLDAGTNFIEIPSVVPRVKNRHIWVGMNEIHIPLSEHNKEVRRPVISVLEEQEGTFNIFSYSNPLSFSLMEPIEFHNNSTLTHDIWTPYSIISWSVRNQTADTLDFEDYMQIAFGHNTKNTSVVTLKGYLNFLLKSFRSEKVEEDLISYKNQNQLDEHFMCSYRDSLKVAQS